MNILLVKLGAAGDIIRTTSLVPGLKERYPDARIEWATISEMVPLIRGNPGIARVLTEQDEVHLNSRRYSLVINADEDEAACHMAGLASADRYVGPYSKDGNRLYTPDSAPWFDMGLISRFGRQRANELKIANRKTYQEIWYGILGLPWNRQRPYVPLSRGDRDAAAAFARRSGLRGASRVIGINTGSGIRWWDKQLSVADTVTLARRITSLHPDASVVLFGGPQEAARNRDILSRAPFIVDGGCGNSIGKFAALIGLCDTLISSDSMALHIATALKKRVVAFFAPTSPWEIELYGHGARFLPLRGCRVCFHNRCKVIPEYDLDEMAQSI